MTPEQQQQKILGYFIEEAKDHLNMIEQGLLNLQATIQDSEMMNEVFRAAHSVKGGAAMLNLGSIQRTSHRLEDYFKMLKEAPTTQVDRELESMFLQVFDGLQALLEELQGPFGLTEDKAQKVMADVEPIFEQLENHLNGLVAQADTVPDKATASPVKAATRTASTVAVSASHEDSALKLVFSSDVPDHLREMLALFKQADTESGRAALQASCDALKRTGEQFDLVHWCDLLSAARAAIGNPAHTYRALAPIIIKELKRSQEQVLTGREHEITISQSLEAILPETVEDSQLSGAILEDELISSNELELGDLFETDAQPVEDTTAVNSDWLDLSDSTADASTMPKADDFSLLDSFAEGEDTIASPRENSTPNREPAVGAAELNSLADLFEGEVSGLDSPWEEMTEGSSAIPDSMGPDIDISDDFSDLLDTASGEEETQKNLADLFGRETVLSEESTTSSISDSTIEIDDFGDDFDDLLNITEPTPPDLEELPDALSLDSQDADELGLDELLDGLSEDRGDITPVSLENDSDLNDFLENLSEDSNELESATTSEETSLDIGISTTETVEGDIALDDLDELFQTDVDDTAMETENPEASASESPAFAIALLGPDESEAVTETETASVMSTDAEGENFEAIADPWSTDDADDISDESALDALDQLWADTHVPDEQTIVQEATIVQERPDNEFTDFPDLELDDNAASISETTHNNPAEEETREIEDTPFDDLFDSNDESTIDADLADLLDDTEPDLLAFEAPFSEASENADTPSSQAEESADDLWSDDTSAESSSASANDTELSDLPETTAEDAEVDFSFVDDLSLETASESGSGVNDSEQSVAESFDLFTDAEVFATDPPENLTTTQTKAEDFEPVVSLTDETSDDNVVDETDATVSEALDSVLDDFDIPEMTDVVITTLDTGERGQPSFEVEDSPVVVDLGLSSTNEDNFFDEPTGEIANQDADIAEDFFSLELAKADDASSDEVSSVEDAAAIIDDFFETSTAATSSFLDEEGPEELDAIASELNGLNEVLEGNNLSEGDENTTPVFEDSIFETTPDAGESAVDFEDSNLADDLGLELRAVDAAESQTISDADSPLTDAAVALHSSDLQDDKPQDLEISDADLDVSSNDPFGLDLAMSESSESTSELLDSQDADSDEAISAEALDDNLLNLDLDLELDPENTEEHSEAPMDMDFGDDDADGEHALGNELDALMADDLSVDDSSHEVESSQDDILDFEKAEPDGVADAEDLFDLDLNTDETALQIPEVSNDGPSLEGAEAESLNFVIDDFGADDLGADDADLFNLDLSTHETDPQISETSSDESSLELPEVQPLDFEPDDFNLFGEGPPTDEIHSLASDEGELSDLSQNLSDNVANTSDTDELVFDDLDALLTDAPDIPDAPETDNGTDIDSHEPATDALLEDTTDFAELDNLLNEDSETPFPTSGIEESASATDSFDFGELDALLNDEETTDQPDEVPEDLPPTTVDDEFSDLEKLLEEADQTLGGGSPSMRTVGGGRSARRSSGLMDQTMRVSVKHLDNLNNLVGELVVNRNSLEQDQDRLRQFLDNLLFQVQQLNDVGQRMRDLYERSLLESSLLASRQAFQASNLTRPIDSHAGNGGGHATGATFDALEMDRFTGFHTLTQEMIELIVRVRESASDIAYTVESTDQIARQFRQVTTQLQEGLNKARMVPFAQTADRLPRAVRDISIKCGKEARLIVEGRDTLIDKMILERLYDPMTHLVNNAITHGIEPPEERAAMGKPREGTITIRAFYQGNQTVIYIADDGAGINPDMVRRKAIQKGIITQAEARAMNTLETYELLFRHGFSTRDKADDFAGRGVGMDVVRTALSEIRGSITIDSELGRGTSFTIRLPLTLSISKALSCLNNQARIAFPMDGVEDMFDVPSERVQQHEDGQTYIQWRDTALSFQPLSELLQFNRALGRGRVYGGTQDEDIISIVVLRNANTYIGIQVDRVLGEQEIVIKQIEGPVPKPMGIAGATVLGDGRVMPIGDVMELIDIAQGRVRREAGSSLWSQVELPPEEGIVSVQSEPTVLIVDDSITVRELLSMSFNKIGYRVEQARDGQEAWEKMRSGLPCDLVFCDIEMPRMDGLELLSRMQKDTLLKRIPIAMLTSRGADRHRQMAVDLGASGYFTKPYLEEALLDAAQKMLKGEVLITKQEDDDLL